MCNASRALKSAIHLDSAARIAVSASPAGCADAAQARQSEASKTHDRLHRKNSTTEISSAAGPVQVRATAIPAST